MDRPDAQPTVAEANPTAAESIAAEDESDALKFFSTKKSPSPKPKADDTPCQKVFSRQSRPVEEECYWVSSYARKGVCLIVDNDKFSPQLDLSERKGSDVDSEAAQMCFEKLGFQVQVARNLPYSSLLKTLESLASADHTDSACLVVVVMSHGDNGIVYTHDVPVATHKLWEPFTADKCPTLAGKPKLFFIQACQGTTMDSGTKIINSTTTRTDSMASYKVPSHADFLLAHSSPAGHFSWRNTLDGSWYMQSLMATLRSEAAARDVVSILTMVGRKVAQDYESRSNRIEYFGKKQMPFFYSTLTYKLYLDE